MNGVGKCKPFFCFLLIVVMFVWIKDGRGKRKLTREAATATTTADHFLQWEDLRL